MQLSHFCLNVETKKTTTHTHNTQQHTKTFSQTTSWRIRLSNASPHHRKQKAVINIFLTLVEGVKTLLCDAKNAHCMQQMRGNALIKWRISDTSSKNIQLTDAFAAFQYSIKQLINKTAWNWMPLFFVLVMSSREVTLLNIARWKKASVRTKILEMVANGHVKSDCPSCKCKKTTTYFHDFHAKSHTDKPGVHEGLRESVGLCFIHSVRLRCEDGVMWRERRKRGGGAYHLWIQHPCFLSKLFHFLALLHGHFLGVPISRSLSLSKGQRGQEDGELAVKNGCCAVAGVDLIFMGFLNEATHVSSLNVNKPVSGSLPLPPVKSHHSSLSLLFARSLSAPAMRIPV